MQGVRRIKHVANYDLDVKSADKIIEPMNVHERNNHQCKVYAMKKGSTCKIKKIYGLQRNSECKVSTECRSTGTILMA